MNENILIKCKIPTSYIFCNDVCETYYLELNIEFCYIPRIGDTIVMPYVCLSFYDEIPNESKATFDKLRMKVKEVIFRPHLRKFELILE